MKYFLKLTDIFQKHAFPIIFFVSFLIWYLSLRGFFFSELGLIKDASVYYEHFEFYLNNLSRGVFPLWDTTRASGIPTSLFLRRIGEFNPIFIVLLVLDKAGLSFTHAYLTFWAFYLFLGLVGFFLLSKRLFNDTRIAYASYLLLMFSSLGTRLFDSYILIVFIPMVWFFYFLVAFSQKCERYAFLGITMTTMILFTTYVPFYFVTIVLAFLLCWPLIYFRNLKELGRRYITFLKNNKMFVGVCLVILTLSCIPSLLFFQEAREGEFVLPARHFASESKNVLSVHIDSITQGGVAVPNLLDNILVNLQNFKPGILYIPLFAYLILVFGIITRMNKKLFLFFLWAIIIFLVSSVDTTPVYKFLYEHVFFFRYFRNLHFFVWLILLPLLILALGEQFRQFCQMIPLPRTRKGSCGALLCLLGIHAGFAGFLWMQENVISSTYYAIALSFVYFAAHLYWSAFDGRWLKKYQNLISLFLLFGLIAIHPLEVNHHLQKNSQPFAGHYRHRGRQRYLKLSLPRAEDVKEEQRKILQGDISREEDVFAMRKPDIYIATQGLNVFHESFDWFAHKRYSKYHKLVAFDRIETVSGDESDLKKMEEAFIYQKNVAFVSTESPGDIPSELGMPEERAKRFPEIITRDSTSVQIIDYDINFIKLKTNFKSKMFLVYNDSYHSRWRAFINGQGAKLYRTNIAFKGLWIPKGENIVYLRYGSLGRYLLNFFFLGLFYGVFIWLLWSWRKYCLAQQDSLGLK